MQQRGLQIQLSILSKKVLMMHGEYKEKAIGAFNAIKNGVRTAINGVISHING